MADTNIFHIELTNNKGKKWIRVKESYIKGFAYNKNNSLLGGGALLEYITNAYHANNLNDVLLELNGNFSCILNVGTKLYLISDKIRSYPLIYGKTKDGTWLIADSEHPFIENQMIRKPNDVSFAEFYSAGYVSGNYTLYKDVCTVDCGEYVIIGTQEVAERTEYFKYITPKNFFIKDEHIEHAYQTLEKSFVRTLNSIEEGRQIVIPLSGGYDSRLIVCLCKKYKVKNVVCYTYGRQNSFEVSVSKQVADVLGFEWHFVEYTPDKFEESITSTEFAKFSNFSSNFNSIPHIQDFLALRELRHDEIIKKNAVVIPGFCGDLFGGSKVPKEVFEWKDKQFNLKTISELIFHHFYDLNVLKPEWENFVLRRIENEFKNYNIFDEDSFLNYYEQWCIQNRLSKYIINSLRVYEFFDMDWRIPLWDDEYAMAWYEVPWRNKSAQLLADFMFSRYFQHYAVDYKKADVVISEKTAVKFLKIILPKRIRLFIRRAYVVMTSANGKRDENCFKATAENISHTCKIGDYKGMVESWNTTNIRAVVSRLEAGKFLRK